MDKVKAQLAVVLKHGFWIGCGIAALLAIGAWFQATSTLAAQAKQNKDNIKSKAAAVQQIIGDNTPHPNDASLKGMDELNKGVAQNVKEGWAKVYQLQREVLVWPDTFDQKFHRAVDNLRPIEIVPFVASGPPPADKDIKIDYRQIYRNYILEFLPNLGKKVGTEWRAVRQAGSSSGGPGDMSSSAFSTNSFGPGPAGDPTKKEDKSIVRWSPANQQEIQNTHFGFCGRVEPPTTLEVLYAQEDLWVLETMTSIIAETNKGAEFYHEASIKDIDYIRIGRNAGGVSGAVTRVVAESSGGAPGMPSPSPSTADMGMPMMPMPGMSGSGAGGAVAIDPADNRYVNANYQLLKAKELRDVITTTTVSEKDAVLAVAKRMPVRMRVTMDQRKLPALLAECANSRLPVEVRQVRVNRPPGSTGSSAGSSSASYSASPMGPEGGAFSASTGGMPFGNPGGSGGGQRSSGPDPNNVTVELFGIIYIYNPPNDAQLGLENLNRTADATTPPANLAAK